MTTGLTAAVGAGAGAVPHATAASKEATIAMRFTRAA